MSNVTDMHGMFANARSFNQPLNKWNVFTAVFDAGVTYYINNIYAGYNSGGTGSEILAALWHHISEYIFPSPTTSRHLSLKLDLLLPKRRQYTRIFHYIILINRNRQPSRHQLMRGDVAAKTAGAYPSAFLEATNAHADRAAVRRMAGCHARAEAIIEGLPVLVAFVYPVLMPVERVGARRSPVLAAAERNR